MNGKQLAVRLGVAESTVSRLLSGDRRPSVDLMSKIRDVLAFSLDEQGLALDLDCYGQTLRDRMVRIEARDLGSGA